MVNERVILHPAALLLLTMIDVRIFLCSVDRTYMYNLVSKTNLVHNLFLVYLYLLMSTCFGRLWADHQEKQLQGAHQTVIHTE
jgi:hypothetical protein